MKVAVAGRRRPLDLSIPEAVALRDRLTAELAALAGGVKYERDDEEPGDPLPVGVEGHPVRRFPDSGAYASGVVWVALDVSDGAR